MPFAIDESKAMAEDGAGVFTALTGGTTKGTIRATTAAIPEEAPAKAHDYLCHAANRVNPDLISLCHGAPSPCSTMLKRQWIL